MTREDFAPDAQDEDLFDFPSRGPATAAAPGVEEVPALVAASASAPGAPVRAGSLMAAAEVAGDDIDEDIFRFEELFTAAERSAGDEHLSKSEVLESGAPTLRGRGAAPPRTAQATEPIAPALHTVTHTATPTATPTRAHPAAGALDAAAVQAQPPPAPPTARRALLAAGFVVVNAALVFFAWQASRTFQEALISIRADLSRAVLGAGVEPRASAAATERPEPGARAQGPELEPAPPSEEWIASKLDSPAELVLEIARREIADGEYRAARRRIYEMLASRDRLPLDDAAAADLEFALADAYFLEGLSLREADR